MAKPQIRIDIRTALEGLKGEVTISRSLFEQIIQEGELGSQDAIMTFRLKGPRGVLINHRLIHLKFSATDASWPSDSPVPPEYDDLAGLGVVRAAPRPSEHDLDE